MSQGIDLCSQQHDLFLLAIDLVDDACMNIDINMRHLPLLLPVKSLLSAYEYTNLVTPLYIEAPLENPLLFLQTNKIGGNYNHFIGYSNLDKDKM